ncbi:MULTISPECIES: bifunctional hydroxymethylpyrimidine kinase/phosphomethylpyrimidine kinase [Acidobacteriaceae]|uniref:bifunctional hydroxymethylpyrimidine kinase/phosphomethylpyrimidine kinase n=1 Tax=Acidobacteriaceae TaxID=204434 RepID=UPI0020B16C21|nr:MULTISPECIES: bifunctional hydroxymethylpyrimidine kinase/phosphomethylpyrimidine kinase [Acidobacteriaceae]MDW5265052.1 bifunctional hydroxymethylpyrimidine kinase/phosphomethylpyrimidine kinase [Edaphobacter sp.]
MAFPSKMRTVLTIAGFDPSSGAGVTADLMVFAAHGLFGTSCITSLTVQSTVGVLTAHPIRPETVKETLDCLHGDLPAAGIKIGMLATEETVAVVADFLGELKDRGQRVPVVLDPVLRSSSGRELLDEAGVTMLRERLLPLVDWVTPNIDELGILTGSRVVERGDLPGATRVLQGEYGGLNVLATGGHLEPPDDFLLTTAGGTWWLPGARVDSTSTHGTGCALSSALLSGLVQGKSAYEAAVSAKIYVAEAIRTAAGLGHGRGPLNHLWPLE